MAVEISFVIPAYNESQFIERCLQSISSRINRYELEAEIILVDNGSTDDTVEKGRLYTSNIHSIGRNRVSVARNYGARHAKYELVAFIDGDVEITDSWVEAIIANYNSMANSPLFVTGAQCRVPLDGSWIEKYWFSNLKDRYLGGANILTTQTAFRLIGGFDEGLETGEDYDFCLRSISEIKVSYMANEQLEAIHLGFPNDLANFYRREEWHGRGDVVNLKTAVCSPVIIIACIYFLLTFLMTLSTIVGCLDITCYLLVILFGLNLVLTLWRFKGAQLSALALITNSGLHFIYFFARFMSMFSKITK